LRGDLPPGIEPTCFGEELGLTLNCMPDTGVILLVEDRADDVELIRRGLRRGRVKNPIQVVRDGEEAISYLRGEGKFSNRAEFPLPALVLLDLKLPGMDGFEVLQWVRSEPGLSGLRVIVLSSSEQIRDVNRAYELGANSFLLKPLDFEQFVATGELINQYWLRSDRAPTTYRGAKNAARQ
jgi:CheY-like chemotaxis protein